MQKITKVLTLAFGQGLNIIVNLLFLPYMARVLDYQEYGTYGQVLLIVSFSAALLSFGLPQIIYVYLANGDESKRISVFNSSLFGAAVIGLVGAIILLLFSSLFSIWFDNDSLTELLQLYSFSLLFILPFQCINSYFIFTNRVRVSAVIAVVVNLIKVVLVITAIHIFSSVYLAVLGVLLSEVIQLLIGLSLTKKSINLKLNFLLVKELLIKGFPLGLTGVLGAGILYVDSVMISSLEGVKSYAIYRNGAIEVPFISTLYASISAIVLPEVAKLFQVANFDRIIGLKKKVVMNSMMLTYPVLIYLLFNSHSIIVAYLGEMYEESAIVFAVFNLTLLIRVTNYSDILISANKSKVILKIYLLTFAVNILLNYILIAYLGIIGAAISTVISLFILAALQLGISLGLIKKRLSDLINFRELLLMLLFCVLLAFTLKWTFSNNGEHSFLLFGVIYFPIIYLILLRFGFFSIDLIKQLLPKFLFKKKV
jgi:O-antigen/teichoic acid export membrane protein